MRHRRSRDLSEFLACARHPQHSISQSRTPINSSPRASSFLSTPAFVQGYGDSPRPSPISRLHMTEAPSAKFLLKKVEPEYPHEAEAAGFARAFADEHIALLPGKRTFERSCSVAVAWHVCGIPQTSSHALTPLADFSGPWPARWPVLLVISLITLLNSDCFSHHFSPVALTAAATYPCVCPRGIRQRSPAHRGTDREE
jgi:hypothetical protein